MRTRKAGKVILARIGIYKGLCRRRRRRRMLSSVMFWRKNSGGLVYLSFGGAPLLSSPSSIKFTCLCRTLWLPPSLDRSTFPSLNRIYRVKLHQVSKVTFWHPISFLGGVYLPRYPVYLPSSLPDFLPPFAQKVNTAFLHGTISLASCCTRYCRRLFAPSQVLGIFNSYTNW